MVHLLCYWLTGLEHTKQQSPVQGKESLLCDPRKPLGRRHTERKETKGTRGLPERHAFS